MLKKTKNARERKYANTRKIVSRRKRRNIVSVTSTAGLIVLMIGLIIYNAARPKPGKLMPDLGNRHIRPPVKVEYNSYPPTSGPHYDGLAPWGIHDTPIPNELQVHNLEDGGVIVQYNCPDGCNVLVDQLTELVERYDHSVLLAPYPEMESRIALTAWNQIDVLEQYDEARIIKFIKEYRGLDHHQ